MSHLSWGLQISALGMGLVFGLLALLWGLLTLVLKLDRPPPVAAAPAPVDADDAPGGAAPAAEQALQPALVAAIAMAVLRHSVAERSEGAPMQRLHWPGSLMHASRWVAAGRMRQNQSWQRRR